MYIDVKKAHLNGEVDDDDFAPKGGWWRCGATTAVVIWDAARSICVGRAPRRELEELRLRAWTCCADGIYEQGDRRQCRGLGRRLHVPREGEVPQGDRGEDGRVV